jgi:hypothetical protein
LLKVLHTVAARIETIPSGSLYARPRHLHPRPSNEALIYGIAQVDYTVPSAMCGQIANRREAAA